MSTQKTEYYDLNQWLATDQVLRTDFNADNAKIDAALAALNSGKVRAAGLDVVSEEPIRSGNPLLKAKNCIITPHISWASRESRQRIMDCTVKNVKAYLDGEPVNVVNG